MRLYQHITYCDFEHDIRARDVLLLRRSVITFMSVSILSKFAPFLHSFFVSSNFYRFHLYKIENLVSRERVLLHNGLWIGVKFTKIFTNSHWLRSSMFRIMTWNVFEVFHGFWYLPVSGRTARVASFVSRWQCGWDTGWNTRRSKKARTRSTQRFGAEAKR